MTKLLYSALGVLLEFLESLSNFLDKDTIRVGSSHVNSIEILHHQNFNRDISQAKKFLNVSKVVFLPLFIAIKCGITCRCVQKWNTFYLKILPTRMHSVGCVPPAAVAVSPVTHDHSHTCPYATHIPCHAHPPAMNPPHAMHTPPHMPPSMHTPCPPCGQTDTCENITFANSFCGR